jgi:hypothetical protein
MVGVSWTIRAALASVALLGSALTFSAASVHDVVQAATLQQGVGNFDGTWYFGGDLTSPALIIQAGTSLTVMNEQGRVATATGTINQIQANWGEGLIVGTLTPDQRQINWQNGTFWQRHAAVDAAQTGVPNVGGIWYVGDDAGRRALIVELPSGVLQLMNEQGRTSPGQFIAPNILFASAWEGGVQGNLSPDGNFIGWSNGTTWRR